MAQEKCSSSVLSFVALIVPVVVWFLLPSPAFASSSGEQTRDATATVQPWFEVGGGGYFGNHNYTSSGQVSATLFQPLAERLDSLWFTQFDGKWFFDDSAQEGNAALGYRRVFEDYILGVYGFYDFRHSANSNPHHKITLGAEVLGETYDARANVYLPLSTEQSAPTTARATFSGSDIVIVGGHEVPLYGVDAEVGGRMLSFGAASELWAYAGGYYFDSWDHPIDEKITGPHVRAEYRVDAPFGLDGSRLTFDVVARYDEPREERVELGVRLRIPFGGGSASSVRRDGLRNRLSERLYRDPDIVLGDSESEAVADALTGVELDQVAYASELASGDLGSAVAAASENTLLIVDENYTSEQTISSGSNITIAGQGSTVSVTGVSSGTTTSLSLSGSTPSISASTSSGNVEALTIGGSGNSVGASLHLTGLTIAAESTSISGTDEVAGIYVESLSNAFYLSNATVSASATADAGSTFSDTHVMALYGTESTSSDGEPLFKISSSSLSADLSGTISGVDAPFPSRVYAMRTHDFGFSIEESTLTSTASVALTAGSGDSENSGIGMYGIRASGGSGASMVENTTFNLTYSGTMTGSTVTSTTSPPNKTNIFLYGVFGTVEADPVTITNSTINLTFDGTIDDDRASGELTGIDYQGPDSSTSGLTLTGSTVNVTVDDSVLSGYDITATHLLFNSPEGSAVPVVLDSNTFTGTSDTLVSLTDGYVLSGSTGNTASSATVTTICSDSGTSWSGSFTLDSTTYTNSNCD